MAFWPNHEPKRPVGTPPPDEFRNGNSLHAYFNGRTTQPDHWEVITLRCGQILDLEERVVHMQRRIIELGGEY